MACLLWVQSVSEQFHRYHQYFADKNGHRQMLDNFLLQSTLTPFVVPPSVMVCFQFDEKSTLLFVGDTLEGMESIAPQRAHTRSQIKVDIVR